MEDLKFKTAEEVMNYSNRMDDTNTDVISDFYTNANKGFAMRINGYRISVQWGPGNYVDRDVRYGDYDAPMNTTVWGCDTAEVLIWDEDGRFGNSPGGALFDIVWRDHLDPLTDDQMADMDQDEIDDHNARMITDQAQLDAQGGHNDQVFGHCSSDCVAKMIGCLASCGDNDPRPGIAQIFNASFK